MKCIAIVPARIGSKSIKKKNLVKVNGISFIEKTIISLKKNKFLDCIAVSTDSVEIQKIAKKNDVWCEFLRPKKISGDKSTTNSAVNFVIEKIKKNFDFIFEIHPTYFFRKSEDLYNCYKKIKKNKYKNFITASKITTCAHKDYQATVKKNKLIFKKPPHTFNKFNISKTYEYNGYIIGSKYNFFKKNKSHFGKSRDCGFYIIEDKKTLIDLNDKQDLELIKKLSK